MQRSVQKCCVFFGVGGFGPDTAGKGWKDVVFHVQIKCMAELILFDIMDDLELIVYGKCMKFG